jgi:hypothetical protein
MFKFKEVTFDYFPYFYRKWSNAEIISNRYNSITLLDSSSYMWNIGNPNGGGVAGMAYSPVSVVGGYLGQKYAVSGQGTYAFIDMSSYVWAWGNGPVGDNANTTRYSPVSVVGDIKFRDVIITATTTFYGIDESSFLWSWGQNNQGNLGDGFGVTRSSPVSVLGGRKYIKVFGYTQVAALDESSFLWTFGNNGSGQLGDGTTISRSSPVSVLGGRQWLDVVCSGNQNMLGLDISSNMWSWGFNGTGQLGDNTTQSRSSPVSVLNQSVKFIKIDTSGNIVVAIDESSNLWQWGQNQIANVSTIRLLPYARKVKPQTLSLGSNHASVLDESNALVSFGYNGNYSFGNGTNINSANPVAVSTTKPFKSFFVSGSNQSMALTEDGELWTWGSQASNADGFFLKSVPSMLVERVKNILP